MPKTTTLEWCDVLPNRDFLSTSNGFRLITKIAWQKVFWTDGKGITQCTPIETCNQLGIEAVRVEPLEFSFDCHVTPGGMLNPPINGELGALKGRPVRVTVSEVLEL